MLEEARMRNAQNRQIQRERERERGSVVAWGLCGSYVVQGLFLGDEGVLTFPLVMLHSPVSALEPRSCAPSLSTV